MMVVLKTITPEDAKNVLATKNNINVRKIRKPTVQLYARQMVNDNWRISWDCIAFDKEGNLLNGQHRLMACVKSNIPIVAFVIYDAEDVTGDTGLKRNIIESLRGRGKELPLNMNELFCVGVLRDLAFTYFGIRSATDDECLEIALCPSMKKHIEIINTLKSAPAGIKKASVVSALIGGYMVTKDDRCVEFAESLKTGISDSKSAGVVIALRDFLIGFSKKTGGTLDRRYNVAKEIRGTVQKSLAAYLNGNVGKRINKTTTLTYNPTPEMFQEEWI